MPQPRYFYKIDAPHDNLSDNTVIECLAISTHLKRRVHDDLIGHRHREVSGVITTAERHRTVVHVAVKTWICVIIQWNRGGTIEKACLRHSGMHRTAVQRVV